MEAEQLRRELARAGEARAAYLQRGEEMEVRLTQLCAEARDHPEITMTEAARLLQLARRATAYDYADRAG